MSAEPSFQELCDKRRELLQRCRLLDGKELGREEQYLFREAAGIEELLYQTLSQQQDAARFKHLLNAQLLYRRAQAFPEVLRVMRTLMGEETPGHIGMRSRYSLLRSLGKDKASFKHLDFSGMKLGGLNLRNSDLSGASFKGSRLERTDLSSAYLSGANFEGAVLIGVKLRQADLRSSYWKGADVERSDLVKAKFDGAYVIDADFSGLDMTRASFQRAIVQNSSFMRSTAEAVIFSDANCERIRFDGANLQRARFAGAKLTDCDFQGATLQGAQFSEARLSRVRLEGAFMDSGGLEGATFVGGMVKTKKFKLDRKTKNLEVQFDTADRELTARGGRTPVEPEPEPLQELIDEQEMLSSNLLDRPAEEDENRGLLSRLSRRWRRG